MSDAGSAAGYAFEGLVDFAIPEAEEYLRAGFTERHWLSGDGIVGRPMWFEHAPHDIGRIESTFSVQLDGQTWLGIRGVLHSDTKTDLVELIRNWVRMSLADPSGATREAKRLGLSVSYGTLLDPATGFKTGTRLNHVSFVADPHHRRAVVTTCQSNNAPGDGHYRYLFGSADPSPPPTTKEQHAPGPSVPAPPPLLLAAHWFTSAAPAMAAPAANNSSATPPPANNAPPPAAPPAQAPPEGAGAVRPPGSGAPQGLVTLPAEQVKAMLEMTERCKALEAHFKKEQEEKRAAEERAAEEKVKKRIEDLMVYKEQLVAMQVDVEKPEKLAEIAKLDASYALIYNSAKAVHEANEKLKAAQKEREQAEIQKSEAKKIEEAVQEAITKRTRGDVAMQDVGLDLDQQRAKMAADAAKAAADPELARMREERNARTGGSHTKEADDALARLFGKATPFQKPPQAVPPPASPAGAKAPPTAAETPAGAPQQKGQPQQVPPAHKMRTGRTYGEDVEAFVSGLPLVTVTEQSEGRTQIHTGDPIYAQRVDFMAQRVAALKEGIMLRDDGTQVPIQMTGLDPSVVTPEFVKTLLTTQQNIGCSWGQPLDWKRTTKRAF